MTTFETETTPRLGYVRRGEQGPPVLLIMGLGMRKELWEPQLEELSATHRLLAFDNRGVGESERGPRRLFSTRMMAEDACRVLDAAGFEDAHVVGVSMGGMIAQEMALRYPARFRSLSLIATHPGTSRHFFPTPEGIRLFSKAFRGDAEARMATTRALLYPPEFIAELGEAGLGARMRAMMGSATRQDVVFAQLGAIVRHRTLHRLSEIRMPTLVVRPGKDLLVRPSGSDALAAGIPGARLLRLDGAGHGVIFQSARELNAALASHVAEAERARSLRARAPAA